MKEDEFRKVCEELGGVFIKDKNGSIKCIFPANTTSIKIENIKILF
jgi:hypothetical protein